MGEPPLFITTGSRDQQAVSLVNSIFIEAADRGVSDIHFEDFEAGCRIRYRIDGHLFEQATIETILGKEIGAKIRMRSQMSIADRDIPLDGRMHLWIGGRIVDVRVSVVPTNHGESIVCRLLDQRNAGIPFDQIDMADDVRHALRRTLSVPDGLILTTGPTGSGKTTTLYSLLSELNTPDRKIVTIEDPVEYCLQSAIQIPITPGMSFARAIRAVLRQDPDVILLGEIRDRETVRTAIQASMTGHLVLSTLNSNDTMATVDRLMDLLSDDEREDPFVLEVSLRGIIAQRLVRRFCSCAVPYVPDNGERKGFLPSLRVMALRAIGFINWLVPSNEAISQALH